MTAQELKIGDTFRRQGYKFTVVNIVPDTYKNGTEALRVECTMGSSTKVDSFFSFKLTTKVK
jgi:outer membrane protein assembly factor BamA